MLSYGEVIVQCIMLYQNNSKNVAQNLNDIWYFIQTNYLKYLV